MAKTTTAAEKAQEVEDLDLFEQLKTLGEGTTIQVYREPGRDFLDTIPADATEVEHIKSMFGGGSYSLRARRNGTWVKKQDGGGMVRLKIAGVPKPGSPGQPLVEAPVPGAPVAAPGTVEARLAEIEARAGILPAPVAAPDSALTVMTQLLVPVLTTALQRQPENSAVEILELARKLAKDQREAGRAGRDDQGDLVRDMGIPLVDFITRGIPKAEERKALPAPVIPDSTVAATVPTDAELVTPTPLPTTMELAARIAAWCEPLERRDRDPRLRAEVFLEDLEGTPMMDGVLELIALPTCLELWAGIAPRVAERKEWYAEFIDELRRLTAPETELQDVGDPVGDPGDASDAPANGEASAERVEDAGDSGARA